MRYFVRHRTTYRYAHDVAFSQHLLHLQPRTTDHQEVSSSAVSVVPPPGHRTRRPDNFGNCAEWLTVDEPHALLDIVAESRVNVAPASTHDAHASEPWESVCERLEEAADSEAMEAVQYIFDSPMTGFTADLSSYARESFPEGQPVLAGAIDLMARIHADFRYDTTVTDTTTPVDRVFEIRAGVCQDLAHFAIAALRSLGLASRYVSGYLLTLPPPGQVKLQGADASHAWFAIWAPPFGWIDLDPTNNVLPSEAHVVVGWGRDYGDVAPINGIVVGGADQVIEVGVDVVPADGY